MSLPNKGKILALDLGTRRTGLALSDEKQKIAFLREEIEHENKEELLTRLQEFIKTEKPVGLLVGLPLRLSGEKSPQTKKTEEQIEAIKQSFKLPLQSIDERWSTRMAASPGIKIVDSRSAQILLETYLGSLE